eukprot:m.137203 g.137203  ORF g.137203 m.137203 type:complete len:550 (+) comp16046_c0_seq1:64-1713(+)
MAASIATMIATEAVSSSANAVATANPHVQSDAVAYTDYHPVVGCDTRPYIPLLGVVVLLDDGSMLLKRHVDVKCERLRLQLPILGTLQPGDSALEVAQQSVGELTKSNVALRFATVFEHHVASSPSTVPSCTWLFYIQLSLSASLTIRKMAADDHHFQLLLPTEQATAPFAKPCDALLSRTLRSFDPVLPSLERLEKRTIPSTTDPYWELQDYHVLQPCYYTFDNPGKGIRSKSLHALAEAFTIHPSDLDQLQRCVDRFHEISLIVDDIEDDSELRRDRECAHIRFGTPAALNSAYLLFFKLLQSVPERFRANHTATLKLLLDGSVTAHRGQGLEIYWRDNRYCPTLDEYVEMVKGKTSTPFVMAAELFFLHATDLRLKAFACLQPVLGLARAVMTKLDQIFETTLATPLQSPQQQVLELFDLTGVFFQIRDDYINLADPQYWLKKGFCDDLHERKYSFPVIYMIQHRLGEYHKLLELYASTKELEHDDLKKALQLIRQTSALGYTYTYLMNLKSDLERRAARLGLVHFQGLLDRLVVVHPDTADLSQV